MSHKCSVCPECGANISEKVAFGLTKDQVRDAFQKSVGPGGKRARIDQQKNGYVLFAQLLEEAVKKAKRKTPV